MMLMTIIFLAASLLTTEALPLQSDYRDSFSWSSLPQDTNQAQDKTHITKDQNGIWKSHVDNSDLYVQTPLSPLAGEKQALVSERLRARLREQLAELRARLWPQSSATPRAVQNVKELLAPLTEQLQSTLSNNVHDLCHQLRQLIQELQPAADTNSPSNPSTTMVGAAPSSSQQGEASYLDLLPQVGQRLEAGRRRMTSAILEFRAKSATVAQRLATEDERDLMLEVAARLGQEAASLEQEFMMRVGTLQASLGGILLDTSPRGGGDPGHADIGDQEGDVLSSTARFCSHTRDLIQQFSQELESQFTRLEERGAGEGHREIQPVPIRPGFLREDFTTRMRSLLQEIMQTLH